MSFAKLLLSIRKHFYISFHWLIILRSNSIANFGFFKKEGFNKSEMFCYCYTLDALIAKEFLSLILCVRIFIQLLGGHFFGKVFGSFVHFWFVVSVNISYWFQESFFLPLRTSLYNQSFFWFKRVWFNPTCFTWNNLVCSHFFSFRGAFRTLSKISYGAFCDNI